MEILQLTSNKAEFSNYLSDPMVLKANSKVALNKASFSVPVIVNSNITYPQDSGAGAFTNTFFQVIINGIAHPITYQNYYDAWTALNAGFENIAIADFYNGNHICPVDNICTYVLNTGVQCETKTFTQIVAHAIGNKFAFYEAFTENISTASKIEDFQDEVVDFTINANNVVAILGNQKINTMGMNIKYTPQAVSNLAPTAYSFTNSNVIGWTRPSGQNITGAAIGDSFGVGKIDIDPNGGWVACRAQYVAGRVAWGINLCGFGAGQDEFSAIAYPYEEAFIDIGITYENNGTHNVFSIIDGNEKFVYFNTATTAEVEVTKATVKPFTPALRFDSGVDYFYIVIRKGRPMNDTKSYTFSIYQGNDDITDAAATRLIYVAERTLKSSHIRPQVVAINNAGANILDEWRYILRTNDSNQEDRYFTAADEGIETLNVFSIVPKVGNINWTAEREFWNNIGITGTLSYNSITDLSISNYNHIIQWEVPKNTPKQYFFGYNKQADIIDLANNNFISYDGLKAISAIPREIAVSLMDLSINPKVGSFISNVLGAFGGFYETGTINKVVNYIQTSVDELDFLESDTLDYVYEAYNIIYRALENRGKLPLTQLKVKVGYKDFTTNEEKIIKNLEGILKIELIFN